MRPLFAIAPLALLLAIAGPRPVRWDAGALARQQAERAPEVGAASTPEHSLAEPVTERFPLEGSTSERPVTASRTSGRGHMGLSLNALTAEGPSPQGRPR